MLLLYMIIYGRVNKINKMLGNSICYVFLKDFKECIKYSECEWLWDSCKIFVGFINVIV